LCRIDEEQFVLQLHVFWKKKLSLNIDFGFFSDTIKLSCNHLFLLDFLLVNQKLALANITHSFVRSLKLKAYAKNLLLGWRSWSEFVTLNSVDSPMFLGCE
jgi:hypothetical protein